MFGEQFLVFRRYDHQHTFATPKAFPEVEAHILGERYFVSLVQLNKVASRMWPF
jgi:hypothetical protein